MSEWWRLGVVERSVLETLDALGLQPHRPHQKCARILERLAVEHRVSGRYGYDALCTMAQPWLLHIPLVDFHGNCGSPSDRPAGERYTEARLSRAGVLALAAERGNGARVPVALINGDLHAGGGAPPYSPRRVIAALLAIIDDPRITDAEIVERVGAPESPTGSSVACDYGVLAAGEQAAMVQTARMNIEPVDTGTAIVVTHLPLGIGDELVMDALVARVNARTRRDEFTDLSLPLRDVRDESYGNVFRIVCELRTGADPALVEAQIASTWGVTTRRPVQLPAPLTELMRELVDDDPEAQRAALGALSDCI